MKLLFATLFFSLATSLMGCATTKGSEVVKVPVSVPCIDPTDVPAQPNLSFEREPWIDGKTAAKRLLVDYYNLQAYATRLEILVTGCTSK